MNVRRLQPDDVPAAARVAYEALPIPPDFEHDDRIPWLESRTAYLAERDPGGAWVAEQDGRVVGMTNAIVRDGIWGLSMMAVDPKRQARGTGTKLLQAALTYAEGTRARLIMSTHDPKAMRLYARAGLDLLPGVGLGGILDRSAIPGNLAARETDDLEAAAALARPVRGGAYDARDLAFLCTRPDSGVLMVEGRGFVLHQDGRPTALAADSEEVATDLLWSALAQLKPGATADVDPITHGQDWAIRVGLAAGLAITPTGPMFTRGELGPLRPWLASGTIL